MMEKTMYQCNTQDDLIGQRIVDQLEKPQETVTNRNRSKLQAGDEKMLLKGDTNCTPFAQDSKRDNMSRFEEDVPHNKIRKLKDSGIPWIGLVPKHWDIVNVKRYFTSKKNIVGDEVEKFERLALTLQGVVKRSKESADGLQPTEFKGYQILRKDELVFKLIDLQNISTSRVGLSPYEGIVSPAYIVLSSNGDYDVTFAEKFFLMMWYNEVWNRLGNDGVRSNLNAFDVLSLPLPVPPLEEQERIATWLDTKCGEIDELIEVEQQMITELEAYRQAVITEAVTKGLNPNASLRNSGIPWIGEIPEHWQISRLKFIGEARNGLTYTPADICDKVNGILVLRSSNIQNGVLAFDDNVYVRKYVKSLLMKEGDILICSRNGSVSLIGKCAIIPENIHATFGAFMMRFRTSINKRFSLYLVRSTLANNRDLYTTSTINQLTNTVFGNLLIPLAPLSEQQEIADYLDAKCAEIDDLIKVKQEKIETLKQYCQSLIFEAVTGKITLN